MTINSDPYLDYIHYNVYGTWDKVKAHPIMDFYAGFDNFNFDDVYFALNIWFLNEKKIPFDRFKKVIISFHTEYIDLDLLWNFFNKHSDCEFLFLSDFKHNNIWPSNVTTCRWISWGYQLEVAVEHHGIAVDLIEPKYKLSSLSNRHEFHKACVTAYLLEKFEIGRAHV